MFGLIIAIVGCYKAFTATGGAEGVGRATTHSVVLSSMLILTVLRDRLLLLMPASAMIRLRGVSKRFGANRVLEGLHLDVERGETMVVIGGSGTGKSVLLKHLIGLLSPDAGDVLIDG